MKKTSEQNARPTVVSYLHSVSHRLKKTTAKFESTVVFSVPDKEKRL